MQIICSVCDKPTTVTQHTPHIEVDQFLITFTTQCTYGCGTITNTVALPRVSKDAIWLLHQIREGKQVHAIGPYREQQEAHWGDCLAELVNAQYVTVVDKEHLLVNTEAWLL